MNLIEFVDKRKIETSELISTVDVEYMRYLVEKGRVFVPCAGCAFYSYKDHVGRCAINEPVADVPPELFDLGCGKGKTLNNT